MKRRAIEDLPVELISSSIGRIHCDHFLRYRLASGFLAKNKPNATENYDEYPLFVTGLINLKFNESQSRLDRDEKIKGILTSKIINEVLGRVGLKASFEGDIMENPSNATTSHKDDRFR